MKKHKYEVGMVLPIIFNCKKCGLLKSTIESVEESKKENIEEVWSDDFNRKFVNRDGYWENNISVYQVKDFIHQLLAEERTKIINYDECNFDEGVKSERQRILDALLLISVVLEAKGMTEGYDLLEIVKKVIEQ